MVFQAIGTSRYLPHKLLQVLNPVIEINVFFAYPENLVLAIIMDDREKFSPNFEC